MGCSSCAKCCEEFSFEISGDNKQWIKKLSEFIKLTRPSLMSIDFSVLKFKAPCKYLSDGRCTIYEDRPKICRDFLCRKAKGLGQDKKLEEK